jgi:hypothetical protein
MSPSHVRWLQALSLAKSALIGVLLLVAYYLLPLDEWKGGVGVATLLAGLILIGAAVVWQVRAILKAPFPRLRGFQTMLSGIPLVLVVFAAVFYLTAQVQPDSFSEQMDKIGALYFTVTVFSTVGFGDITAKTDLARTLVTIQMLFNLIAKVILGAVNIGQKKRSAEHHQGSTTAERPDLTTG